MTIIYFKDKDGRKIAVEVTEEVATTDIETRREEWRNNAKERYHCKRSFDTIADNAIELRQEKLESNFHTSSPEDEYIAAEEARERRLRLVTILASLITEQLTLVKMLRQGKSVTEIAAELKVSKAAVSQMRKRIQEKFENI